MSHKEKQGLVLGIRTPQWLNWRIVGLIFVVVVFLFIAAVVLADDETSEPPTPWKRLKNIARLSTVEFQLSTVVKVINPRKFRGNEVLVYGVCGRVVAGMDLSKLTEEDIQTDGLRVRIKLPRTEIFTLDLLLEDSTKHVLPFELEDKKRTVEIKPVCEQTFSWDTPIGLSRTPGLVTDAQEEALKAFKKTAEESGILAIAQAEVEKQLEKLLLLAGYEDIEFEMGGEIESSQDSP